MTSTFPSAIELNRNNQPKQPDSAITEAEEVKSS